MFGRHVFGKRLRLPVLLSLVFPLLVAGCSSAGKVEKPSEPAAPEVRQVTQSAYCALTGPGVAWVRSEAKRDQLLGVAGQNMATELVRSVDLSRESLVFVTLGQKPSAGYSVTLDGFSASDGALAISVKRREPAPGMATAQVLTSPCAVLAIQPADWRKLTVTGLRPQPVISRPASAR